MPVTEFMTDPAGALETLWSIAFGRCRAAGASPEDAQDCAQEAIAELLAHPEVRQPHGWVATVAYRRYVDLCRLRGRERTTGLVPAPIPPAPEVVGPDEVAVGRAHARWLVNRMHRLPVSTRAVCATLGAGLPRVDVGARFGLTPRAVESHLTRARRLLRRLDLLSVCAAWALARSVRAAAITAKPAAAVVVLPPVAALFIAGSLPPPTASDGQSRVTASPARPAPPFPVPAGPPVSGPAGIPEPSILDPAAREPVTLQPASSRAPARLPARPPTPAVAPPPHVGFAPPSVPPLATPAAVAPCAAAGGRGPLPSIPTCLNPQTVTTVIPRVAMVK